MLGRNIQMDSHVLANCERVQGGQEEKVILYRYFELSKFLVVGIVLQNLFELRGGDLHRILQSLDYLEELTPVHVVLFMQGNVLIHRGDREPLPVRRYRQPIDRVVVVVKDLLAMAVFDVPHPHDVVLVAADDELTIRTHLEASDRALVVQGNFAVPFLEVPHLDQLIFAPAH